MLIEDRIRAIVREEIQAALMLREGALAPDKVRAALLELLVAAERERLKTVILPTQDIRVGSAF